ncbi:MAG: dihydroxyacetone kinase subunit DhaK [Clostridia bacterium]
MQKFVNSSQDMVDDSIGGFVKCFHDLVAHTKCSRTLKFIEAPIAGKVGVVTGGGWGHDPAFMGYIGKNMLDAVAIGNTFTPPSVDAFLTAFRESNAGKGVVCLYGNYPKDIQSAQAAIKMAAQEGIVVRSIIANDDVASEYPETRRGMTGEVLLWKIGGAAAAMGYDLDGVAAVSQKAMDRIRSIGVGLASCIIPEEGRPNYLIEMGTMEIGVGHHGLSSKDTCKLKSANATADIMVAEILRDMPLEGGDRAVVMISGLGNTMLSELNILYSRVDDVLQEKGIEIYRALVGNYFTSLDMMGATLTIMKMDDELETLFDYPAYAVGLSHFNR